MNKIRPIIITKIKIANTLILTFILITIFMYIPYKYLVILKNKEIKYFIKQARMAIKINLIYISENR